MSLFCRTKGAVSQAYLTNFSEDIPYNEFCLSTKSICVERERRWDVYYELYIDVLFLVNFMMDYILLLLVRKMLKCTATHGNICIGAMTGSFLTCLVIILPVLHPFLKFILFHVVVNTAMIKQGLRSKI